MAQVGAYLQVVVVASLAEEVVLMLVEEVASLAKEVVD